MSCLHYCVGPDGEAGLTLAALAFEFVQNGGGGWKPGMSNSWSNIGKAFSHKHYRTYQAGRFVSHAAGWM